MQTEWIVLEAFAQADPSSFAMTLDEDASPEAALVLQTLSVKAAQAVIRAMAPLSAARALEGMSTEASAALIRALPVDQAAALMRRCSTEARARMLGKHDEDPALRPLRRLLENEPDSAGALMDPLVLALPEDLTASAALDRIRKEPEHAMYYVYVVDADGHLTGVVNVRELMLSAGDAVLRNFMTPKPHALPAQAGREAIASHPAWQRVHALPVVDRNGELLGAIRYEIVRRIEGELGLGSRGGRDRAAAAALAELYVIGLSGITEFATSAVGGGRAARGGKA